MSLSSFLGELIEIDAVCRLSCSKKSHSQLSCFSTDKVQVYVHVWSVFFTQSSVLSIYFDIFTFYVGYKVWLLSPACLFLTDTIRHRHTDTDDTGLLVSNNFLEPKCFSLSLTDIS